jgi:hypothetical protein
MTHLISKLENSVRVYIASNGVDENSMPVSGLRLSTAPAPPRTAKSPPIVPPPTITKWLFEYSKDTWEHGEIRIYLLLNERFHQKEYVKTNILKQVTGGTGKAYTEGIERLTVSFAKSGPWTEMDPQASKLISNVGVWLVSYAIKRRKEDCGIAQQALQTLVDSGKITTKVRKCKAYYSIDFL